MNHIDMRSFRFQEPRQEKIYENLSMLSHGSAAFYKDACHLLAMDDPLESTTHLVGHLMREIESCLREVLKGMFNLNNMEKNERKNEIKNIIEKLQINDEANQIENFWYDLGEKENEFNLHRLAHRNYLRHPRSLTQKFKGFFQEFEKFLDIILVNFRKHYLELFKSLDSLINKDFPTKEDAKFLANNIPNNEVTMEYFFKRLDNPAWIKPLWEKDFFKNPPGPQENTNDGSKILPYWPESRYLARMAKIKPDDVLEVILDIPDSGNFRIYEDILDAALNMPPDKAVKLIDKVKIWATSEPFLWFSERFSEILRHLIDGGEIDAAMELAKVILEVFPDPDEKEIRSGDDNFPLRLEPSTHFNSLTDYENILKVDFSRILEKKGLPALEFLCELLKKTIHFSKRHSEKDMAEDYSYFWRPAIEDHEQNHPRSLDNIIVKSVRDGFEYLAKEDKSKVQELVQILESRRPKIFRRIALHLIREFSGCVPQLVSERLTNRALFDDIDAWHEYALLLKNCFGMLSTDNQQSIFGWIMEQTNGAEKKPQEKWQLNRLSLIENFLPPQLKLRYEELKVHGQPQHPEFNFYHSINCGWGGPSAAIEKDKLISMPVSDIAKFLKEWQPVNQGIFSPSPEGQGKELESVIGQEPERFVNELSKFEGVEPTYVRHLISGFCAALKQNKRFPWPNVLKFCLWVVNQPRDAVRLTPGMSNIVYHLYIGDPDWVGARQSVVELLAAGLDENVDHGICIDQRKFVWTIIEPLTQDPDPTPENDMNEISSWSIRIKAIDAVIRYALWIRRHNKNLQEKGFDVMPEVREVLNEHLDASKEPSLSVRSIYGQWFPWLVSLDEGWANEKASMIFPLEEPQRKFFHAAWDDYIIYCAPYDGVFEILREQYALAVDLLASKTGIEDADKDLVRQLMVFYYRGKLELTDPQGLFAQFWLKTLPGLRAIALEFIGRSLKQIEEEISSEIIDRLKRLWLQRLETGRNPDQPDNYNSEMAAFTWWINSGKFESRWSLDRLKDALEIATETNNFFWPEVLSECISSFPIDTMQCLKMLIEKDRNGWQIQMWNEELKEVLNKALTTETSQEARNIINYLGSRGYLDFRDLLQGF